MGEINLTPFEEEESFTATGLSNRFSQMAQQGIDDLTAPAFQDGCLTQNHLPSLVSFCDTKEFHADAVQGYEYTSGYDGGTSKETGLSYWNARTVSNRGYMNYPPNDGTWGVIQDGAGNNLSIALPAAIPLGDPDFNDRFGVDSILVMFNAQVERVEFYELDGTTPFDGPIGLGTPGAAFCIQISDDSSNWHHLYMGDSQYTAPGGSGVTGNPPYRYRMTERLIEFQDSQDNRQTASYPSSTGFNTRKEVAIRTIINASSLANTVNETNSKGAITSVQYIRAVISLNKAVSSSASNPHDKIMKVRLRKASLTVMALRASEVQPNA